MATTHKVHNTSIWYTLGYLLPLILLLIVSTMACYKIQKLEKEIQFKETDYQILLQICNEKG